MPPLLVFHSARPLPARLAAAVYLGWLPARCPADGRARAAALARLGTCQELLRPQPGLRAEGVDRWGRPVYSAGPGTNPAVLGRALAQVAGALGVPPGTYCLVPVPEHLAEVLLPLALGPQRALPWLLGLCWPAAAQAAVTAAQAAPVPQAAAVPGGAVAPDGAAARAGLAPAGGAPGGIQGASRAPEAPPHGQPAPPDEQPAPVVGGG